MELDALMAAQLHRGATCLLHKMVSAQMKCEFGSESYISREREREKTTRDYDSATSEALEGTWNAQLLKAGGTNIIDIFKH